MTTSQSFAFSRRSVSSIALFQGGCRELNGSLSALGRLWVRSSLALRGSLATVGSLSGGWMSNSFWCTIGAWIA